MTSPVSRVRPSDVETSYTAAPAVPGRGLVAVYMAITAVVLALLMVFGLLMRASQAGFITISPDRFFPILTPPGIGMGGVSRPRGAGGRWDFLSPHFPRP